MEPEFFIEIQDYPDYYISTYGRVLSIKNNKENFLKPQLTRKGYKRVGLSFKGKRKQFLVHRLVALHFIENPNPKIKDCVDHINRIKDYNKVENLRWVSNQENAFNTKSKGYHFQKNENCFTSSVMLNGKRKTRSFYIPKYGYEEAKQKAILWRNEMKMKYHKFN